MDLTSPDFEDGGEIPREQTCDGEDAAPQLDWSGVPSGVVELALTCEDPDAPGGTFVHWVAWGIDPAAGSLPPEGHAGIRNGRNGFGRDGYGGPCPPPGDGPHHYEFALYALDGSVGLEPGATIDDLRSAIDGHIRATATLMGIYQR